MNLQTTIGIIVLLAFASYIYVKWRRNGSERDISGDVGSEGRACEIAESAFLDAIENICGGAAFVFDSSLRLLSCGKSGFILTSGAAAARHVIDVLPPDTSPMVIERMVASRAGQIVECNCSWDSKPVRLVMLSLGKSNMGLIVIPPCACGLTGNAAISSPRPSAAPSL